MDKVFLLFFVSRQVLFPIICDNKTPPSWSDDFRATGVIHAPNDNIEEPFQMWTSKQENKFRIDSYGGTEKFYCNWNFDQCINSITDSNEETPPSTCVSPNYQRIKSLLPTIANYKYAGEETVKGYSHEKWMDKTQRTESTIWLFRAQDPVDASKQVAIPVNYSYTGYDDYFYIIYEDLQVGEPDPKEFIPVCNYTRGAEATDNPIINFMWELIDPVNTRSHIDSEFDKFVQKYSKKYATSEETENRKKTFRQKSRYVNSMNRQHPGYQLAINHFADRTESELQRLLGFRYVSNSNLGQPFPYTDIDVSQLPDKLDWREKGAVTPVKDQLNCGSCWSFSATGAIEGAYFLKHGELKKFSEQVLVDCSWGFGNHGCEGGDMATAYNWVIENGGIPTEESYPYISDYYYCHADNASKVGVITGYVNVKPDDPNALRFAIFKYGPVSVAIDAEPSFWLYSSGIYYNKKCSSSSKSLHHAVLVVGYGSSNGRDYWIIKNSFSEHWGAGGYFLMAVKDNNCGVMTIPSYVTM